MNTITYKGKEYPTRTFTVTSPEFGEEQTYTIATNSLFDAISKDDKHEVYGTLENAVDNKIYFYVEDEVIKLDAKEICANHLDIEMELIEEIV